MVSFSSLNWSRSSHPGQTQLLELIVGSFVWPSECLLPALIRYQLYQYTEVPPRLVRRLLQFAAAIERNRSSTKNQCTPMFNLVLHGTRLGIGTIVEAYSYIPGRTSWVISWQSSCQFPRTGFLPISLPNFLQ